MIPLFKPPKLTGKYVSRVLASGWYTSGKENDRLREAVGALLLCDPAYVVLASSATSAFQGLCYLLREEINTASPSVRIADATWPGMLQALYLAGFVRAVDSPVLTVRTCIGGDSFSREDVFAHSGIVVEDRCHAWTPMSAEASYGIYSMYPTKLVPGVEGGVIVCRSSIAADRLREYLYCGLTPGAAGRGVSPTTCGIKANMTDVAAALNLEAVELAPEYMRGIAETHHRYMRMLVEYATLCARVPATQPYLMQLLVTASNIPSIMGRLSVAGIHSAWNFKPDSLLTLPMWPHMPTKVMKEVLCQVTKSLR